MSYGFGFGFPRLASLAAAGSPFATLGPTLDLNFVGTGSSSGLPGDNDSLNLDFIGNTYQVGTQYSVWTSTGLQPGNFQNIVTFSRASTATFYNSSGYLTTTGILNYLTYSNTPENAAGWNKQDSFVQTNLLTYSEQFDNAAWTKANATVTANQGIAPDGTNTADSLVATTTGPQLYQTFTVADSTIVTGSVYLKRVSGSDWAYIRIREKAGASYYFWANLSTGATGTTSGSPTAFSVTSAGNGWYRLSVSGSSNTGATTPYVYVSSADANGSGNAAVNDSILVWGAQLVQGAVPGNYQATTAAALPVLYADWTGALTARKICQNAVAAVPHGLRQNPSGLTGSTTYTLSFYAKAGESTKANAWQFPGTTVFTTTAAAVYDLVAGTATGDGSPTIQSVGNGWYRCTKTITTVASPVTGTIHIGPTDAAGNQVYNGDGTSGVYITDMQIEVGTSVGPYYETTQYVYNAPRFDYDPVTLQPRGLLIEELRTNLLFQSNDFFTSWSPTNITRTLNSTLSPSGNVDGVKIEATAAVGTVLYQGAAVAATAVTGSVYAKLGTSATIGNTFGLRNQTTATDLVFATVNYSTGAIAYVVGSSGVTATNVGNGWWRITITATSGITSGDNIRFYVGFSGIAATAGDFLYAYGAQLEAGDFATSYIPTVASQVTRAADVASVNTLSPWYNAAAGTLFASVSYEAAANGPVGDYNVSISDGTVSNIILIGSAGAVSCQLISGGVSSYNQNIGTRPAIGVIQKTAFGYSGVDANQAVNGTIGTTDTSTVVPSAVTKLSVGSRGDGSGYLNGWILRITYYPRRMTNAELQSITT